ncbi:MAG: hypothetical protein KL801_15555 [Mesorhizobium sp.]|nr:hypothetical protein [Mesorhizobium sp.]
MPKTPSPLDTFKREENRKSKELKNYIYDARSNYVVAHRETLDGLSQRGRLDWAAANGDVRIAAAITLVETARTLRTELSAASPRVSSVVVSAEQWFVNLHDAHGCDIRAIRRELSELFRSFNYLGVVEPGFYPRRKVPPSVTNGAVSWHAHLLFWGRERDPLARTLEDYNAFTRGVLFGVPAATLRSRSWNSFEALICYAQKTPSKSYSTRRMPERADPMTGEIIAEHDRQLAQQLRPGQQMHMRNVLREFCLDDLLLAGGTGKRLLRPLAEQIRRDRTEYRRLLPREYQEEPTDRLAQ